MILATTTLAGVAAAAPEAPMITVDRALTVQRVAGTDGWRALPDWSGAGGVGAASSLGTSLRAIPPAQGLFQHQLAATELSDDGVGVDFEVVGGVKQTFAIRGHVVDLMYDAEENDEGSK